MKFRSFHWLLIVYGILLGLYTIWSYALTTPNLVLTTWSPYWVFQNWIWSIDRRFITAIYIVIITLLFAIYFSLAKWFLQNNFRQKVSSDRGILLLALTSLLIPLILSYNALSHDVFNYIFNARMVMEYGANPHFQTALQFADDEWVRFMHNIHTPAPYWYGWTALSVIPYILGLGKFITTWVAFRLWSTLGLGLLLVFQFLLLKQTSQLKERFGWVLLFALNPLVMIEVVSNVHNDAWMMWPAVASLWLIFRVKRMEQRGKSIEKHWLFVMMSVLLLGLSMSIKIATILLLPFWVYLVFRNTVFFERVWDGVLSVKKELKAFRIWFDLHLFDLMSITLFIPLLTTRAQQFHPWYLLWPLAFLPFLQLKWWRNVLLLFSVTSMLRYVPWMWNGAFEFTDQIQFQQRLITFIPILLYLVFLTFQLFLKKK